MMTRTFRNLLYREPRLWAGFEVFGMYDSREFRATDLAGTIMTGPMSAAYGAASFMCLRAYVSASDLVGVLDRSVLKLSSSRRT